MPIGDFRLKDREFNHDAKFPKILIENNFEPLYTF